MTDRFTFVVSYEEPVLRAAARAFVIRGLLGRRPVLAGLAVLALAVGLGAVARLDMATSWAQGVVAGVVGSLILLIAMVWWTQLSAMRAKLARMVVREATVRLSDDSVSIEADSGSAAFAWRTIKAVWETPTAWLLILGRNQFVTLPLRNAPADALSFIKARLEATHA